MTGANPVLHAGSFGSDGPVRSTRPWARTFRGTPASVSEARRFVAELLAGCPAREVLMTCVSELCANAIAHTASGNGGAFTVEVDRPWDGVARVAVTDDGGPSLPAVGSPGLLAEGGRGLALVAACTSRWGYTDACPGRTVWAEASWPVPAPAPVFSPGPFPGSAAASSPGPFSGPATDRRKTSRPPRPRLPRFRRSSRLPADGDGPSGPAA